MQNNQTPILIGNVSILDVAAALGLEIEGRNCRCFNGAGHQSGRDEHPSLVLFTDTNKFKCFVCGKHGDAIDLVRGHRSCTFPEALQFISSMGPTSLAGSSTTASGTSSIGVQFPDKWACDVYLALYRLSQQINQGMPESVYLHSRGLTNKLAAAHGVRRLADPAAAWNELNRQFDEEILTGAGIVSSRGNFMFHRHTLLFFYLDGARPVYVQARDVTGEAEHKELSLHGLRSPIPFNRNELKPGVTEVCVCEGCIDTLSALKLGYAAVGVPGVNGFQPGWFDFFRAAERVRILFDNDPPGQLASERLRNQFLLRGYKADSWHPAVGKDVNDLLKSLVQNQSGG